MDDLYGNAWGDPLGPPEDITHSLSQISELCPPQVIIGTVTALESELVPTRRPERLSGQKYEWPVVSIDSYYFDSLTCHITHYTGGTRARGVRSYHWLAVMIIL